MAQREMPKMAKLLPALTLEEKSGAERPTNGKPAD
jgi:hypothetical protein